MSEYLQLVFRNKLTDSTNSTSRCALIPSVMPTFWFRLLLPSWMMALMSMSRTSSRPAVYWPVRTERHSSPLLIEMLIAFSLRTRGLPAPPEPIRNGPPSAVRSQQLTPVQLPDLPMWPVMAPSVMNMCGQESESLTRAGAQAVSSDTLGVEPIVRAR